MTRIAFTATDALPVRRLPSAMLADRTLQPGDVFLDAEGDLALVAEDAEDCDAPVLVTLGNGATPRVFTPESYVVDVVRVLHAVRIIEEPRP